jgi:diguanylate cyclase (GGDEF)-like protein
MDPLRQWWRRPDHFDWLSSYLAAQHVQRFTRFMMCAIVLVLGATPVLMTWSPDGPRTALARGLCWAVAAMCTVMAALWAARWPTREQSMIFASTAAVCIAVGCLVQSSPTAGLSGCAAYAALGGYVAFFHTSRILLFTLATAAATATACAVRIAAEFDTFGAISKLLVVTVGVLAVPTAGHVLVHFLGVDALKSHTDPLTQLPNRRGFRRSMRILTADAMNGRSAVLAVVMVDLDAFKRVNDTEGHAAGDRALVHVADILRRTRRADSVVGRMGGEEFVVGLVGARPDALGLAERLRREIAASPWRITASLGIATTPMARVEAEQIRELLGDLVESADRAMYVAKRAGGNRIHVAGDRPPVADRFDDGQPTASPIPRRTTATAGSAPWTIAERALSRAEATSTSAAASIDPTPAKTRARPGAIPPEIVNPIPTKVTTAKKRL